MEGNIQDKVKEIKSCFRLYMNGVVSQSMREKGLGYKINWGIGLPELKSIAARYGKDYDLAIELWKEDIRECKILATLIMPALQMKFDLVELWVSQIQNQEIAEMSAFNLFQYVPDAKDLAFKWISSEQTLVLLCGYNVLARLFAKGVELEEREINEFIDQAQATYDGADTIVRHAVSNAVRRFGGMNDTHMRIMKSAFKTYDLDFF